MVWCSPIIHQCFCMPSIFHLWKLGFGFPDPRVPNYRLICGWEAILLRFPLKLPSFSCRLALFCFLCGVKTIENGASRLKKSLGKRRGVDALMLGDFDVLDPYHEDWTPKQPLALVVEEKAFILGCTILHIFFSSNCGISPKCVQG